MEFEKYYSLTNSYKGKFLSKIEQHGFAGGNWFVTEKVHGANFSFMVSADSHQIASRNGILEGEAAESFYNIGEEFKSLQLHRVRELYDYMLMCGLNLEYIQVYGEFFGGGYSHPDVEPVNVSQIQKGVQYAPDHQFRAFDILVKEEGKEPYLEARPAFEAYCNTAKLQYLPILKVGTMHECLEYPVEFVTKVPDELGLPTIEGNFAEGYVARPMNPLTMGTSKVAIKVKHPNFQDKVRPTKAPRVIGDNEQAARDVIELYIHQTRLESAMSKVGPATSSNIGLLLREMIGDVLADFAADDGHLLEPLEKAERKALNGFVQSKCRPLILANIDD